MEVLKTALVVSTLAATTLALAQTAAPQKEPPKPQPVHANAKAIQTLKRILIFIDPAEARLPER